MITAPRPTQVSTYAALLAGSALFMIYLGTMAAGYYVPAACLSMQAALIWSGRGFRVFEWVMLLNQISGLVLIIVLWLGDGLGTVKHDIAGTMLLLNLLLGGPLMSVLAIPILGSLRFSGVLPGWFQARGA